MTRQPHRRGGCHDDAPDSSLRGRPAAAIGSKMRDDRSRTCLVNRIADDRIYCSNARYDKFLPNRHRTRALTEVTRVGFEGGEDVETFPGADESAAGAFDAALVEWVGDECYGDTTAHQGASDG